MIKKLEGRIIYLHFDEVSHYTYKENELGNYNSQQLERGMITSIKNDGVKKVIFDVLSSEDDHGGYITGFFYPDGKFLGRFYYIADAKLPNEPIDGTYKKIKGGYEIKGTFYIGGKRQIAYYLRLIQPK